MQDEELKETASEAVDTEQNKKDSPKKKEKNYTWLLLIGLCAMIAVLGRILPEGTFGNKDNLLMSPFGNEPIPVWVELETEFMAENAAAVQIEVPESLAEDYADLQYWAYTYRCVEFRYVDENGDTMLAVRKSEVEMDLANDNTLYQLQEVVDVDGKQVVMKGTKDTVSVMTWNTEDGYYAVVCQSSPISREKAVELAKEIK